MGMSCAIQALTASQIEALYEDPSVTWDVFSAHVDGEAETMFDEPLCQDLSLDKSWAIVRFLLLKAAGWSSHRDNIDPSTELLYGDEVGDQGDYYGPYLRDIKETRAFAKFLRPLTLDKVMSHFDWQEMRKESVYLVGNDQADEEVQRELREYAGEYFRLLREYVLKAADSGCGLFVWVN
jgi:hypothetical protein